MHAWMPQTRLLFEFPGLELPFTDWVPLIALFNVSVEVRFLCDFRPTRPIFWGNGGGRPIASWLVSSPPSRPLSSEDLASIIWDSQPPMSLNGGGWDLRKASETNGGRSKDTGCTDEDAFEATSKLVPDGLPTKAGAAGTGAAAAEAIWTSSYAKSSEYSLISLVVSKWSMRTLELSSSLDGLCGWW